MFYRLSQSLVRLHTRWGHCTLMTMTLVSPVFGNLFRGLVQPVLISGQTDHLDRCKPLGRIRSGIAQWRQLARGHQNLNVTLSETQQLRRRRDIKVRRQTFGQPRSSSRRKRAGAHTGIAGFDTSRWIFYAPRMAKKASGAIGGARVPRAPNQKSPQASWGVVELRPPKHARNPLPSSTPASFIAATIWNSSPSCPMPAWI